jgi:hypothetical protein
MEDLLATLTAISLSSSDGAILLSDGNKDDGFVYTEGGDPGTTVIVNACPCASAGVLEADA